MLSGVILSAANSVSEKTTIATRTKLVRIRALQYCVIWLRRTGLHTANCGANQFESRGAPCPASCGFARGGMSAIFTVQRQALPAADVMCFKHRNDGEGKDISR